MSTHTDFTIQFADRLMAEAEKFTGLNCWGDPSFRENLYQLIRAYELDIPYKEAVEKTLAEWIHILAVGRLRINAYIEANPEILEVPIKRPLIVTGMPRTGTTILQNLLSLDPLARPMMTWESLLPVPSPEPETFLTDRRIALIDKSYNEYYSQFPALRSIHETEATGPNECEFPISFDFACHYRMRYMWRLPSFFAYLQERDMTPTYAYYKQILQVLSWKFPHCRWILKAPMHLPYLKHLLNVFPDASIVVTHRQPHEAVGSMCMALTHSRPPSNPIESVNPEEIGRECLESQALVAQRYCEIRPSLPDSTILDVDYRQTVKDPVGLIRNIYKHFDYTFQPEFETLIHNYLEEHRQHKWGRIHYELIDYNLTAEEIDTAFAHYRQTFAAFLP